MASLGQTFDFSASAPSSFDPLPAGWYVVEVMSGEVKETKAGTGTRAAFRFDVRGGAHDGRVVFGSFNLTNPNPKAAEIGREQLGQLALACGLVNVADTNEFLGKRLEIKLIIKPADAQYDAANDVKGYRAIKGGLSTVPTFAGAKIPGQLKQLQKGEWSREPGTEWHGPPGTEREALVDAATEAPRAAAKSPPWAKRVAP